MKIALLLTVYLFLLVSAHCYGGNEYDTLERLLTIQRSKRSVRHHVSNKQIADEYSYPSVYVSPQDGLKDLDKISVLPGQPDGTDFNQYSGYVTTDPKHGKALFYYFTESPIKASTKPLVLWLNGGPGCSSLTGAMMEHGPFQVNADHKTLTRRKHAWNKVANILFLESPAGVGFSYSNTSSDYEVGDEQTAKDSYTFLVNWLERYPEYKKRDFYIAGQSYAGHYIPQLAQVILNNNKIANQTVINLKGIAVGNAYLDYETINRGMYDFFWSHAIISDKTHKGISSRCNFSDGAFISIKCRFYLKQAKKARRKIHLYDIYAPLCSKNSNNTPWILDPCSKKYIHEYLNDPNVQQSLHVKSTEWSSCGGVDWQDSPFTVLPVVQELMASGIRVWLYSGDTDARCPVTETRYDIAKLKTSVITSWYPWMYEEEVGGYVEEYTNLTFVTIRGAGHSVPSYQPGRAISFFTSFLQGKLP